MISVEMDGNRINRLLKELESVSENIGKELGVVSHKAGKYVESVMAKEVSSNIAIRQKDVKRDIYVRKLRPAGAEVTLQKKNRFPLKRFRPRHTKAGVTYKIDKNKPRQLIPGAFTGPRPGLQTVKFYGHAFKRKDPGQKKRLPIIKAGKGPSAAGVISTNPARMKKSPS